MNALKPHLQTTVWTLLRKGSSQREIARVTGIDRKAIRAYAQRLAEAKQTPPGWPPARPSKLLNPGHRLRRLQRGRCASRAGASSRRSYA